MNKKLLLYGIVWLSFLTFSCRTTKLLPEQISEQRLYQQAILEAMTPDSSKISSSLVEIGHQNNNLIWKTINNEEYLLVVAWKQNITYFKPYLDSAFYNTSQYPIWVTTAPELLNRMKKENYNNATNRLKKLLGLPPNATYSYFVEFWVKPADLFRPCPDKEIADNHCELCFPANADQQHIEWINQNRITRYYQCNLYDKYPWTQLGYTYDWNNLNTTHVGLSEFVISTNSNIVVNAIYTTEEYLKR